MILKSLLKMSLKRANIESAKKKTFVICYHKHQEVEPKEKAQRSGSTHVSWGSQGRISGSPATCSSYRVVAVVFCL